MAEEADRLAPIRLAREPAFRLGGIEVLPATRQIVRNGVSETLEPRVMQVLVALAQAEGGVLSRDELIARCWDGRVVGDNAIHRAVSRVRELGLAFGGAFELETITKVGYRMIVRDGDSTAAEAPASAEATPLLSRRLVLAGGAAAVVAATAAGILRRGDSPSAEAEALYRKGEELREGGDTAFLEQSLAYFREATRLDPGFAPAWGALALAYCEAYWWRQGADSSLADRSRSAADRALQLDPENPDAATAKIIIDPVYGDWLRFEQGLRGILDDHPNYWRARFSLGNLLQEVGRWTESVDLLEETRRQKPFMPLVRYKLIAGLWGARRVEEAEAELDSAFARWPRNAAIWQMRYYFLAHTGRPLDAISFASAESRRPADFHPDLEGNLSVARALATGALADIELAEAAILETVRRQPEYGPNAIQALASIGRRDAAFAAARRYYRFSGPVSGAPDDRQPEGETLAVDAVLRLPERITRILFNPITRSLREDDRFPILVRAVGLDSYWRSSGTMPDHLRP